MTDFTYISLLCVFRMWKWQVTYNVYKLKDENVHKEYNIELQNRFEELAQMVDVEDEWENIRETINQTAGNKEGEMDY